MISKLLKLLAKDILFWIPWLIVFIVIYSVSADPEWGKTGGEEVYTDKVTGTTRTRQAAFVLLGSLGAALVVLPRLRRPPNWSVLLPTMLLMAYVFASSLWSIEPSVTIKRAIVLACIMLAGFGLGRVWDYRRFCQAIIGTTGLLLVISILMEIRFGTFLTMGENYRFSGVIHPARQAFNCGFLMLASLSLYLTDRRKFYLYIAGAALLFMFLTKARTGSSAALVGAAVLVWNQIPLRLYLAAIGLGFVIAIGGLLTTASQGDGPDLSVVATMGRDEESADPLKLTGRLPIWTEALKQFSVRPIEGYGFGGFWTKQRLAEFERKNGWALTHSHSAYVETLVNLGLIGFSLIVVICLSLGYHALRLRGTPNEQLGKLFLALLTMACIASFTETAFVADGYEVILMATCLGLVTFDSSFARKPFFETPHVSLPVSALR